MNNTIDNNGLNILLYPPYTLESINQLYSRLTENGTFAFPRMVSGLFPAANLSARGGYSGYHHVWVRDNIHIAHAHWVTGSVDVAVRNIGALLYFFDQQREVFEDIIDFPELRHKVMKRPHIRFDGASLERCPQKWSHAQNDALGYFLWLTCRLALDGQLHLSEADWQVLGLFPLYFKAIEYWRDEDSGHWEEAPKIEASSIGVVVAALTTLTELICVENKLQFFVVNREVTLSLLDDLITQGRQALDATLPAESTQSGRERAYDSALLFLIYPLAVVSTEQADVILDNVVTHLQGEFGIRRYLGDSFWCADYDQLVSAESRTADVSEDILARDALVKKGGEAQWCVFDPILSVIYGQRYQQHGKIVDRENQIAHFNRSLRQLTDADSGFDEYRCPELYFRQGERYVPNDVTPLLWTQANLMLAFYFMDKTLNI